MEEIIQSWTTELQKRRISTEQPWEGIKSCISQLSTSSPNSECISQDRRTKTTLKMNLPLQELGSDVTHF